MKVKIKLGIAGFYYTNWKGEKLTKKKRGFSTKKEALNWEKEVLSQQAGTIEMTFREFFELYKSDKKPRIRENTWRTKEAIVTTKIMPYLGDLLMNEISSVAIIQWQNVLMNEIFLMSSLNRSNGRNKRKNEAAYIRYLEDSIKKSTQYGNQKYWDYNYHRKSVGDNRE